MGVLPPAASKHKFEGIGKASALATFAAMALNPALVWFTQGLQGRILFWILSGFYSRLASLGLVMVNVGVANAETLEEKGDFDGSFDDAFKAINEKQGRLTPEDIVKIDDGVIRAFRKFAVFGRLRGDAGRDP